jgi:hypothetical protein
MILGLPILLIFHWRDVGAVVKALPEATKALLGMSDHV